MITTTFRLRWRPTSQPTVHRYTRRARETLHDRQFTARLAAAAVVLLLGVAARAPAAQSLPACTADDFSLSEIGCPIGSGPCVITQAYNIDEGCELDFGDRDVTITATGKLNIGSGSVIIDAQNLTLAGGSISGLGTDSLGYGGSITINTTAAFAVQKAGAMPGKIDTSGNNAAGDIAINSDGAVTIAGNLVARALTTGGVGGAISIDAGLDLVTSATGQIVASGDGAEIDLNAERRIDLGASVTANGAGVFTSDGGIVNITAGGDVIARDDLLASSVSSDGGNGGAITIEGGGAVQLLGHVSANGASGGDGGSVTITADSGDLAIADDVQAIAASPDGSGGTISLTTDSGSITTASLATITVRADGTGGAGGTIEIDSGQDLAIGALLDASGGDGGLIDISAGLAVTQLANASASATRTDDTGTGGSVNVNAGTQAQLLGQTVANGSGGGDGGAISVIAAFGDLTVAQNVQAKGSIPGGTGGTVALLARGTISVAATAAVSARSDGSLGAGGSVDIEATVDVSIANQIDASGGAGGGTITGVAGGNATVAGNVTATGRVAGANGGTVSIEAGRNRTGNRGTLMLTKTIDASGGSCDPGGFCSAGGEVDLEGCVVTINSGAIVRARGSDSGGTNSIIAHERLTVLGHVDATASTAIGTDGSNVFQHSNRTTPTVGASLVAPAQVDMALAACTSAGQTHCLVPCPTCGNGAIEFPETCDNSLGAVGCDGCSAFCQIEDCNDSNACTTDICDPLRGCFHQFNACIPASPTPSSTPTPSPGSGSTATPTPTPTPTSTPLPTEPAVLWGDANCDGKVTSADLSALIKLLTENLDVSCGADANGNGVLDPGDLSAIIGIIGGETPGTR